MSNYFEMDTVTLVAVVVLISVFGISFVSLILVCKLSRYCHKKDLISEQYENSRPEAELVDHMEEPTETDDGVQMVDDVGNRSLNALLKNSHWVNDAHGLAPHCLEILKTCHMVTEKMVAYTMKTDKLSSQDALAELVLLSRRVPPRVDGVMKALYPPLDPRLLEARCTSLVLSVTQLVLVTKSSCQIGSVLDWIDHSLATCEEHLQVLREASLSYEAQKQISQNLLNSHVRTSDADNRETPSDCSTDTGTDTRTDPAEQRPSSSDLPPPHRPQEPDKNIA